jgi:hypothetical protein
VYKCIILGRRKVLWGLGLQLFSRKCGLFWGSGISDWGLGIGDWGLEFSPSVGEPEVAFCVVKSWFAGGDEV